MKTALAACLLALFLTAPAQAQDKCLSRPSIQQKLLPLIEPLKEALTAVAVGRGNAADTNAKLAEASILVDQWQDAPPGADGCRKRVK